MVRNTLLKWAASAALACAVPAIGLARHTPTVAASSATTSSHVSAKPASLSATTSISTRHVAHHRITKHSKHHKLTARHHKTSKLSAARHKPTAH
ncbi:MAG TPA: hypothetical protein VG269_03490 [Tepidisphaeraceae bacterium]|jgi:hypothetical protein|nr:hypothetical protein [Tepidisphaeraceae bacterium]